MIKSKYKIYLDMDGVLSDFEAGFKNMSGQAIKHLNAEDESDKWAMVEDTPDFWLNLPVMAGAGKLLHFLRHHEHLMILSSPGVSDAVRARRQKRQWITREVSSDVPVIFRRGRAKAEYAAPDSILIDDMEKNTKPWAEKGGIAILHKSAELTIATLKKHKIYSEVDEHTGE